MARILIVNDDGVDSPMLPPMAARLAPLGEVCIAVPAAEQSWQGKAMTRFGSVRAERRAGLGAEAYAVHGTPADCVNLALHHLFAPPPEWVVSGINIGANVGLGFVVNSGTVGAAFEAALQGVPAVAFSTYLQPALFREWNRDKRLTGEAGRRAVETTTARMADMMARIMEAGLPPGAMILNVNFPGPVTPDTPVRWVPVQNNRYGAVFRPEGDGYVHAAHVGLHSLDEAMSDRVVIMNGEIAVTPLTLAGLTTAPLATIPLD